MAKNNYSAKLENMLEGVMNSENREEDVKKLEEALKVAQATKKEVEGKLAAISGKNVQGKANFDQYKSGLESKLRTANLDIKEISNKIGVYKAYEKHGTEVMNIREYEMMLQNKLTILEADKKISDDRLKGMKDAKAEIAKETKRLASELERITNKKNEVEAKIKGTSDEEELKKLKAERAELIGKIEENNRAYQKNESNKEKFAKLSEEQENNKKLEEEISKVQVTIGKCNLIWTSLLKGKDWKEIQAKLEKGNFTAKKGTIDKIRELKVRDEKTKLDEEKGKKKDNKKGKDDPTREENNGGNNPRGGNGLGQRTSGGQGTNNPGQTGKKPDGEKENPDEEGKGPDEGANPPKQSFAQKHPKFAALIAKIPVIGKGMKKQVEAMKDKEVKEGSEKTEPKDFEDISSNSEKPNREAKDLKYISNQIEKGREAEILESVAKKGIRETVQVDTETRARLAKVAAANREAAKFDKSSRYQGQAKDIEEKSAEPEK